MKFSVALEGFRLAKMADGFSPNTINIYGRMLKHVLNRMGDIEMSDFTEANLQAFWIWFRNDYVPNRSNGDKSPLTGRSLDSCWIATRSFFRWAVEEKLIPSRPDLRVKRPKYTSPVEEPFTQDELRRLIVAVKKLQ